MYASVARMQTTEHILLESDFREVRAFRTRGRSTRESSSAADFADASCGSRSSTITILRYARTHRSILLEYVLDLRFVDEPRRFRHIAWRWITFSLLFNNPGVSTCFADLFLSDAVWQHDWLVPDFVSPSWWCGNLRRS